MLRRKNKHAQEGCSEAPISAQNIKAAIGLTEHANRDSPV
jgi:hypothetical protein